MRYESGDGWFAAPENNWCTSLTPGLQQGDKQKVLRLNLWNGGPGLRVSTNPRAVQLILFPHEEVEYFSVNLGVFLGDDLDGRVAVAEHLRQRFKYHGPGLPSFRSTIGGGAELTESARMRTTAPS